ncbi:MAG: hypothetical protein ACJ763_19655 [Bdellovibrionia bacterium]
METLCVSCRKPRVDSTCGVCEGDVCKKCRIFLPEDTFSFESTLAPELKHTYYCAACFDEHVEPFKSQYETALDEAKQINVIYKGSKSSIRILRKADKPIQISHSPDRDETILRLAFQAAKNGFNAIIDVEVSSQKVRNEGYQKMEWSGQGTPAEIKSHELGFNP